jgi:hypothetical protein
MQQQYKTPYGTIFAVKEHNGAPAIMCRAEHSETWSLSSMIAPYTPGAWTAEELQFYLDNWAATKGWKPVEDSPACLCVNCTCTGCHEECYGHCHGCGHPVDHCNSYQTEGEKRLRQNKEDAPCNEEQPAPTGAAAATTDGSAAVSTAGTTTTSESGADARNSPSAPADTSAQPPKAADAVPSTRTTAMAASGNGLLPAFDYTGLNVVTVDTLHLAENIIRSARQKYIVDLAGAVDMAHEELVRNSDGHNQHTEETFVAWCRSVGISKTTAYQLLQVQALITGATPEEQAVLEAASPSLLYAAAKPSAPAELVQAVKDGDITTHKQYQDLLARYDAEKAAREKAEKAAKAVTECYNTAHKNEEFTLKNMKKAQDERDTALRRAAEAEKQRDGARDALAAAKLRGDKLKAENDALKAHPIEAQVVDEEEIDRRAQARANELTAPLREELEALRNRHPADPEAAEQAIRDAYDSTIYTGRVIENAWHTLRPLLPCMDAERRDLAIRQLSKTIATIQGEIAACL